MTAILTARQIDVRIRERAQAIRAVPGQVDAHVAAVRPERPNPPVAPRIPLRNDPARLAKFRARYRATFRKNERDRVVYFALIAGTDAVKIGYARDPQKRMKALFSEYGVIAEVIGTIPGDQYVEGSLHYRFRRSRVHHRRVPELFAYSVIKDAIAALIALQPEFEELIQLPYPSLKFKSAALDAICIATTAKRLLAVRGRANTKGQAV